MTTLAEFIPARRGLPAGRFFLLPGVTIILALLAAPLWADDNLLAFGLNLFMSVALAESWLILSGFTGYISLGHAVFYGLGAYLMAVMFNSLPWWVVLPLCGVASGVMALLVGYPALRVRGPYFVILTLGLSELVKFIVVTIESDLGNFGRILMGAPDTGTLYEIMLALAVLAFGGAALIQKSRFGAGLRAIREDETAAETIGIGAGRLKLAAFAASAIIPGMVGGVMAMRSAYFEPMTAFDPLVSFTIVTTAMIGGIDSPLGPLLGALILGGGGQLLWARAPQIYNILLGVLLVVFVLYVPEGIYGKLAAWRGKVRKP